MVEPSNGWGKGVGTRPEAVAGSVGTGGTAPEEGEEAEEEGGAGEAVDVAWRLVNRFRDASVEWEEERAMRMRRSGMQTTRTVNARPLLLRTGGGTGAGAETRSESANERRTGEGEAGGVNMNERSKRMCGLRVERDCLIVSHCVPIHQAPALIIIFYAKTEVCYSSDSSPPLGLPAVVRDADLASQPLYHT